MAGAGFDRSHHLAVVVFGLEVRSGNADARADSLTMIAVTLRATLLEDLLTARERIRLRLLGIEPRHQQRGHAGAQREPPVESPPERDGHAI